MGLEEADVDGVDADTEEDADYLKVGVEKEGVVDTFKTRDGTEEREDGSNNVDEAKES